MNTQIMVMLWSSVYAIIQWPRAGGLTPERLAEDSVRFAASMLKGCQERWPGPPQVENMKNTSGQDGPESQG